MIRSRPLIIAAAILVSSCTTTTTGQQEPINTCGASLEQPQLLDIFFQAIEVAGGDSEKLEAEYEISIESVDCDFLISAVHEQSTNHLSLTIDRTGNIKTWPWCCEEAFQLSPREDS